MIDAMEDVRTEFKYKLNESLEKEVIAFLNTEGGTIYIGVDDNGKIAGVDGNADLKQRQIKDRLKNNIMPSCMGLFEINIEKVSNTNVIRIDVIKGKEKPYYLKDKGMIPDGCFFRVGSSVANMEERMIVYEYTRRMRSSLKNIKSPKKNLEFKTLKIYYEEKGYEINDNFLTQLNLIDEDGDYNYIAYLLADNNDVMIQFAKYNGADVVDLLENENYGDCCLLKVTDNILNKFKLENKTFTLITDTTRKEIKQYDFDALKEVITNAIIHNDWTFGYTPKFELFTDKVVISSHGGVQEGFSEEEFLQGFTKPKNPELMRVFHDLDFVEQLGTGIKRILKKYDKNIFQFYPNNIRVSIPFNKNTLRDSMVTNHLDENAYQELNEMSKNIIQILKQNPHINQEDIANMLGVTDRTIRRHYKALIENGFIERVGADKNGYWHVLK